MQTKHWNLIKSAKNGAIFGLIYGIFTLYRDGAPINLANDVILHYVGGLIVGSVVGEHFCLLQPQR